MDDSIARLFYLAQELRSPIPSGLVKSVPQGEILQSIASFGISGAELGLGLNRRQLKSLVERGSQDGRATLEEWKYLISIYVTDELIDQRDTMKASTFMSSMDKLNRWVTGATSIIETSQSNFSPAETDEIPKWNSAFEPWDLLMQGGFYQGIFLILGFPGSGKTSHLAALAESLRRGNVSNSIWFFQTEIPEAMFRYRLTPITRRTEFRPGIEGDQIFYGLKNTSEVLEMVQSYPDPSRIIIYDSPDILAGGGIDEGRRFEFERIFRDFVLIKTFVKGIFAASQVRRRDRAIKITSAAEAWSKAWYTDGLIGIQKIGVKGNRALIRSNIPKNRFGPADYELTYEFDNVQLEGYLTQKSKLSASGWNVEDDLDDEEDWS